MSFTESLIGFDLREMWLLFDETWDQERRATYLLNPDIYKPLSLDRDIWPSVLDIEDPYFDVRKPYRTTNHLWLDLTKLRESFTIRWGNQWKPSWVIAVTEVLDDSVLLEAAPELFTPKPSQIDSSWKFLGYDIVAEWGLYTSTIYVNFFSSERALVTNKWGSFLNGFHLFNHLNTAIEFANWSDVRDAGRGPYSVYGLYCIDKHSDNF
jgi:hypothetical protein